MKHSVNPAAFFHLVVTIPDVDSLLFSHSTPLERMARNFRPPVPLAVSLVVGCVCRGGLCCLSMVSDSRAPACLILYQMKGPLAC